MTGGATVRPTTRTIRWRRRLAVAVLALVVVQPNLGPMFPGASAAGRTRIWSDPRWSAMPSQERATRKRIVQNAESQVAACRYREYNSGQPDVGCANVGTQNGNKYAVANGQTNYVAWCAIFVTWVWRTAGASRYTALSPAVSDVLVRNRGTEYWRTPDALPSPGDIAIWKGPGASHVAVVIDSKRVNGEVYVKTIGGNESDRVNPMDFARPGLVRSDFQGYASPFPVVAAKVIDGQAPTGDAAPAAPEDGPEAAAPESVLTLHQEGTVVTVTATPAIAGTTATIELRSRRGPTARQTVTFDVGESSKTISVPPGTRATLVDP